MHFIVKFKTSSCSAPCLHSCSLYFWSKKQLLLHETQRNGISRVFFSAGPGERWDVQLRRIRLPDFITHPRKRLSVNHIRAASQTSPGVRCYRASPTMLHCSLHIAYPPQRSGGFQWGNHEVRRSPFVENNAEEFFLRAAEVSFRVDAAARLWRGEKFPITVFCPQRGLNRNYASALKSQITNLYSARGAVLPIFVLPE